MAHLTLNILAGCVFGMSAQNEKPAYETVTRNIAVALDEVEKRAFKLLAIIPLVNRLPLPSKLRIDASMREVRRVVQHIIDERKKGLSKSACKGPDLLDLLLAARDDGKQKKFTDEEIYEEAITFVSAGHETTSNLMTWALYNLAANPEVYQRCLDEVDSVMSIDNEFNASMLSLLPYTEAVLKETLRLYPPVPLLFRTAVEDNTLVASDGKHIHVKKGTELVLNLYMLHHSEKYWPEPSKFDPSRFDQGQSEAFLPFAAGSRSCIGQNFAMIEAKILLATILQQFHFELVPDQTYVPAVAITMRPSVWLDAQVNATEDNRNTQRKLGEIINHLKTFDDENLCHQNISSLFPQDRLVLIISGRCGR
ncbi:unnamed protein product [Rotaria sordida]|uniref:Cytochrome P450 n=1 Tax=Rotaria sordida TaxID=392033 RepID=A0A815DPK2_9BILA|nr:unnamed protein product [Rotaria sordida]CAF1574209.1 unnamed protein product [Rotaria sordida]